MRKSSCSKSQKTHGNETDKKRRPVDGGLPVWHVQNRCVDELIRHGSDPRQWRNQRKPDGSTRYEPGVITSTNPKTGESRHFWEVKPLLCLPSPEKRLLDQVRPVLTRFCQRQRFLWTGIANLGALCSVHDVGKVRSKLMSSVRAFFEDVERSGKVEHLFTVIEETIHDKDGTLKRNAQGAVMFNVHAHFLLAMVNGSYDPKASRWYGSFGTRFGVGSGIEPAKSKTKLANYLLKRSERADLLEERIYVEWCRQIEGQSRFRLYGRLRHFAESCRKSDVKLFVTRRERKVFAVEWNKGVAQRPAGKKGAGIASSASIVTELNTVIGTRPKRAKDGSWEKRCLIRNPHGSLAAALEQAEQIEEARKAARAHLLSNTPRSNPAIPRIVTFGSLRAEKAKENKKGKGGRRTVTGSASPVIPNRAKGTSTPRGTALRSRSVSTNIAYQRQSHVIHCAALLPERSLRLASFLDFVHQNQMAE